MRLYTELELYRFYDESDESFYTETSADRKALETMLAEGKAKYTAQGYEVDEDDGDSVCMKKETDEEGRQYAYLSIKQIDSTTVGEHYADDIRDSQLDR